MRKAAFFITRHRIRGQALGSVFDGPLDSRLRIASVASITVYFRHLNIHKYQVESVRFESLDGLSTVGDHRHGVALLFQ